MESAPDLQRHKSHALLPAKVSCQRGLQFPSLSGSLTIVFDIDTSISESSGEGLKRGGDSGVEWTQRKKNESFW